MATAPLGIVHCIESAIYMTLDGLLGAALLLAPQRTQRTGALPPGAIAVWHQHHDIVKMRSAGT